MNGIHVINDPNGNPAVLTIDLHNLDADVSPLVDELLYKTRLRYVSVEEFKRLTNDNERADWRAAAHAALNRGYGDDEPDYSDVPAYTTRTRN